MVETKNKQKTEETGNIINGKPEIGKRRVIQMPSKTQLPSFGSFFFGIKSSWLPPSAFAESIRRTLVPVMKLR
jgi:hypothetical protein